MSSFTEFGYTHGPVEEVPCGYIPEMVISDEEFEAYYNNREVPIDRRLKNKILFLARDYSLMQFQEFVTKFYEEDVYGSVEEMLTTFPKERLRALFWGVENCSCCLTHCHNRPTAIDSWEDDSMLTRVTQQELDVSRCYCHCRMWKRKLRRAFFDVPDMPALADVEPDMEESDETLSVKSESDDE
jgi:hypothetical protein